MVLGTWKNKPTERTLLMLQAALISDNETQYSAGIIYAESQIALISAALQVPKMICNCHAIYCIHTYSFNFSLYILVQHVKKPNRYDQLLELAKKFASKGKSEEKVIMAAIFKMQTDRLSEEDIYGVAILVYALLQGVIS